MAEHWISASKALQIVGDPIAICSRLHSGLLKSRAELIKSCDTQDQHRDIPKSFWWANGHEALQQDWERGDFSTVIDGENRVDAFGVSIGLIGLLEMLPIEQRSSWVRKMSVAGSADWVSARDAQQLAHENGYFHAGPFIIEQARLGLVSAKAVEAHGVRHEQNFLNWDWEEREWEIPIWFWRDFDTGSNANTDWGLGQFNGGGVAPNGSRLIELSSVHFLRSSIEASLELEVSSKTDGSVKGRKAKYDWPNASNSVWSQIYRAELIPENQAQIEKALQALLAQGDREPSESTVRPHAKLIWGEYSKA